MTDHQDSVIDWITIQQPMTMFYLSSGGSRKKISSLFSPSSRGSPLSDWHKAVTTPCTRDSGADAPAVTPIFLYSDNSEKLSDIKVSKDAIIETVAEKILNQDKPVAVIDSKNNIVGVVRPSKVINIVFGGKNEKS